MQTHNADTLRNALDPTSSSWAPPAPRKRRETMDVLLEKLSEVEVHESNPDYASYEITV